MTPPSRDSTSESDLDLDYKTAGFSKRLGFGRRPAPPIERRLLTMHGPVGGVLLAIEQQTTFGDEQTVVSSIQVTRPAS